jgi:hypothetical protein
MISSWEAFNASVNVIYYFKLEIMEKKKKDKMGSSERRGRIFGNREG